MTTPDDLPVEDRRAINRFYEFFATAIEKYAADDELISQNVIFNSLMKLTANFIAGMPREQQEDCISFYVDNLPEWVDYLRMKKQGIEPTELQ